MLFIAPVVSQSLVNRTACSPADAAGTIAVSALHHNMAMPPADMLPESMSAAHCDHVPLTAHRMMPGQAMSPMEEIACGYCQLLIHLPFVQFMLTALLWLMLLSVCSTPPQRFTPSPVFRAWTPQRARAPPAVPLSP